MSNVWRAFNYKAIKSNNNRRSTAAMLETLQIYEGRDAKTFRNVQPTALILDADYVNAALRLLEFADIEVRLCAYAWRWYENEPEIGIQKLNTGLYALRNRGIRVRALVDTEAMKNTFATLGFDCRSVISNRMLHTKAIAVDDMGVLIGSHNLTKRANTDNFEASILNYEPHVVLSFCDYFDRMWAAHG